MANYSIKADLLKVQGAFVTNLKGKTATKRCLCIPIDDSGLFLGEKGCYLNLTAVELREPKYNETHFLKVNFDRAVYDAMTEEQRKAQPIVGGMKPLERQQEQMNVTTNAVADGDDLLF